MSADFVALKQPFVTDFYGVDSARSLRQHGVTDSSRANCSHPTRAPRIFVGGHEVYVRVFGLNGVYLIFSEIP
jgi:hypothetical protein